MHIPKYNSKNFSLAIEHHNTGTVIVKKTLEGTTLIPHRKQIELYNILKKHFGDTYITTNFNLEDDGSYKAISPHITGELLCNFSSLHTTQLKQLILFQKKCISLALSEGIIIDFFGSDPYRPVISLKDNMLYKLHKIKNPHYSSNIIRSDDEQLFFVDTLNHKQDYKSKVLTKHVVFLINLSILVYGLLNHIVQYSSKQLFLHSYKKGNASSSASQEV